VLPRATLVHSRPNMSRALAFSAGCWQVGRQLQLMCDPVSEVPKCFVGAGMAAAHAKGCLLDEEPTAAGACRSITCEPMSPGMPAQMTHCLQAMSRTSLWTAQPLGHGCNPTTVTILQDPHARVRCAGQQVYLSQMWRQSLEGLR
jgi:hypothetical protein